MRRRLPSDPGRPRARFCYTRIAEAAEEEEVTAVVDEVLGVILKLVLIVLAGAGIYGVVVLVSTLRSLRVLAEDVDAKLPSLLADADVTAQALSLELMRLDDILTNVQEVSDTAAETTRAAQEAVHIPLVKAAEYAERARRFITAMRER